ncbi:hypothetical protein M513_14121 [Trichuris suis]|uniref:Uncharacterized protein n=1 Tax=Trichuris suis TaxID=68888 RepID=A0A085LJ56_9BILA|nr:hypothetical protein M513_14121 [Trichuris suis]
MPANLQQADPMKTPFLTSDFGTLVNLDLATGIAAAQLDKLVQAADAVPCTERLDAFADFAFDSLAAARSVDHTCFQVCKIHTKHSKR